MTSDPRTPVLVGAAVANQRDENPLVAVEAIELMARAIESAAADAGAPPLASAAEMISVPEGTWSYADPGRLLAERFGAPARSVVAEVGVLQQDVISDLCVAIGRGELDVAVVVGGEARYRAVRARAEGVALRDTIQADGTIPDRRWSTPSLGIDDLELTRNIVTPAVAYALIESARGGAIDLAGRHAALGSLYEGFAAVAASNPDAWDRHPYRADELVEPSVSNRMIASPYTKLLCSQWNVDQAAALILCSTAAADRFGVAADRRVFPIAAAVSNHAVPVLQRSELGRSPGAELAAQALRNAVGIGPDDLAHVDLYSCFPAAVETFAEAWGLGRDRDLTVTGGMSLAGGPLNNYVLQAMVRLVSRLRAEPDSVGLSSSVSGFLTKSGFGLWSATPVAAPFRQLDVSERAARAARPREVRADHVGPATIAAWTVEHAGAEPHRAVVVADTGPGDNGRTIASTGDPEVVTSMLEDEWTGRTIDVQADGSFRTG